MTPIHLNAEPADTSSQTVDAKADRVVRSARSGQIVLWEEIARDGAQARTVLPGPQRAQMARACVELFGPGALDHLIFAAGFPSAGREELEATRYLVHEVDGCNFASHSRPRREEIALAVDVMTGAHAGRASFFLPTTPAYCAAMKFGEPSEILRRGVELARMAVDRARPRGLAVDIALADASRADPSFLADLVSSLHAEGVAVLKLCDSAGALLHWQTASWMAAIKAQVATNVVLGLHQHNDFGQALACALEALACGVRVFSSSWLGLAERAGLLATEQFLVVLQEQRAAISKRLGQTFVPWQQDPDLHKLVGVAQLASSLTRTPLRGSDPVVGEGVYTTATGTPFSAPSTFEPYDPQRVLGLPRRIVATQLASLKLIETLAAEHNVVLNLLEAEQVRDWVKRRAYERGSAVTTPDELVAFIGVLRQQK